MRSKIPLAALVLVLTPLFLAAAPSGLADDDDKEKKAKPNPYRALASRATQGTPKLDGRLDEPVWALAQPITEFVQRDPNEGQPASERTEVRVLYDDGALYIGVRAYDSEPDKIVGQLTRRDQYSPSDWLAVSIDSYFDRRTAFEFRVNPAGVERDKYLFDDTNEDDSWDAVWDVATQVDAQGWVAEFRIPFSQLRFSAAPQQVWGFNIERVIQRKNETVQWKPIPKDASGWVSEYGDLAGIEGITPPRRLEILPYVVSQQAFTPAQDGNPFQTGRDFNGSLGADIKYGLTNSLTLNLTINPDFGQVEADPSVVNLSAFETFFEEKRPFFLEGANIFNFSLSGGGGIEQLFYSRRIGRQPQGFADARGGFVDTPNNTTIIGATKVSGKTANGWSIGLLDAFTAEENATVIDADRVRHRDVVEPLTNYGVLRVQRDLNEGRSAIGFIGTAVNRDLPTSLDYLRNSAYAGGIDARHRFGGGDWQVSGQLLASHIRGSEGAIVNAQRSSARYFQRPDADHVEFDSTRTSLTGTSGAFSFQKMGGGHWRGSFNSTWISPGFEVNDLGFLRQADVWRNSLWVGYREFQPGKIFRRYNLNWNGWDYYTLGGEGTARGTNVNGNFTLLNYWGGFGGINRQFASTNTRVLRGGPSMKGPGAWNVWGGFFSDSRKLVQLETGFWWWGDDERSHASGIWLDLIFRPTSNLRLTLGPWYDWSHDDWQYVTTGDALGAPRYVTGVLDQKTVAMTTRVDWTFTSNFSLQVYAQPFVSAGDYTEFRQVVTPKADTYDERFDAFAADRLDFVPSDDPDVPGAYQVDLNRDGAADFEFSDPNFNFKQLRSTVVLRWEYVSGSTLFFVWSQSRTRHDFVGRFAPFRDLDSLRKTEGDNIFSITVNYYLNP